MLNFSLVQQPPVKQSESYSLVLSSLLLCRNEEAHSSGL